MTCDAIRRRAQRALAALLLWLSGKLCGDRPLSLTFWLRLRLVIRLVARSQACLAVGSTNTSRSLVGIPELANVYSGQTLGGWSLDPDTIRFLWRSLLRESPKCILEFGSGKSTLMLAAYAQIRYPDTVTVISLEQNAEECGQTLAMLTRLGLEQFANVIWAPVDEFGTYEISTAHLAAVVRERSPDWVLIDGPSGPPGCRVNTLLNFGQICAPFASWYLDDAFRDGELAILNRWSHTCGLRVDGIHPIGKGLARGIIQARPPCGTTVMPDSIL